MFQTILEALLGSHLRQDQRIGFGGQGRADGDGPSPSVRIIEIRPRSLASATILADRTMPSPVPSQSMKSALAPSIASGTGERPGIDRNQNGAVLDARVECR
jgi:hypothetical protein